MRILLVNYRYFISGGPEKYMFNIKQMLETQGHEVIPFSVLSNKNIPSEYDRYFVKPIGNYDATYYEDCKKTPKVVLQMLSRSVYSLYVKKAIQKEIRDMRPDLVYIIHFINKLSPSVIRGAKQMGVPVVLRLSDYFLLCPRFDFLYQQKICEDCLTVGYRSCLKKRCVKGSLFASAVRVISMKIHYWMKIYRDVDAFISPSRFLRSKLEDNGFPKEKIHYIPTFTICGNPPGVETAGSYGLYFGRITEEKGVVTAIRAYETLTDHQLIVAGDDTTEEAARLKKYVSDHNLSNVKFVGFKHGGELEEIIRGARFAIIPSIWYDNLPNTALEAFQHGKPVIASDIGSLPELVTDGVNGYLFPPADVNKLIEKIQCLDDDVVVLDMGKNNREKLDDQFSTQKHLNALLEVFGELRRS